MANRFTSSVRPDDEPRRDPTRFGHDIGRAFEEFKKQKRTKTLEDREDSEFERQRPLRELTTAAGEVEAENYLRDQGGFVASDGTSGTMPGAQGGRIPSRFDPNMAGDIFRQERVGLARGSGRGGDGSSEAGAFVGSAPGQPAPEPATDQDVIALPGQFMGNDFAPEVVRQPPRRRTIGGREFVRDPNATADARGQAEQEEQFNRQVQELVAAGVDPQKAPAIVRQGLADEFISPEQEPVTFDPDRGVFPDPESRQAYLDFLEDKRLATEGPEDPDLNPMRGEFPDEQSREAFLEFRRRLAAADEGPDGEAGGRDRRIEVDDAFDRLQELYSETNRYGDRVSLLLPEAELVRLAEAWARGEIGPEDLPRREDLMEQPVQEEEESPGRFTRIGNFFRGEKENVRGEGAARAGTGAGGRDPRLEATVDSARAVVREFPGIPPSQLRTIMEEEGFDAPVIDQVLQGR